MSVTKISQRYGQSLLELAQETNALEAVVKDINLFQETLSNRDLINLLSSPIVKADKKISIVDAIYGSHFSDLTKRYFHLIIKKGREALLPNIAEAFIDLYKKMQKVSTVSLKVAEEMEAGQLEAIKAKLADSPSTEENIELDVTVDKDLIGGFVLEMEGRQYDESVRSKISNLKKSFSKK